MAARLRWRTGTDPAEPCLGPGEVVVNACRFPLGRRPGTAAVIAGPRRDHPDLASRRRIFVRSPELAAQLGHARAPQRVLPETLLLGAPLPPSEIDTSRDTLARVVAQTAGS